MERKVVVMLTTNFLIKDEKQSCVDNPCMFSKLVIFTESRHISRGEEHWKQIDCVHIPISYT